MYQDKTITCKDCGTDFVFTAGEQEFYAQKGFANEPGRCPECRAAKKQHGGRGQGERQMYEVTCSSCGVDTKVPFRPTGEKPVYCRDCYMSHKS